MKALNNEKGLTLIEVILAITLLSIILISFMSFFPQMGLMNRHNEDKTQAINTAKEVLVDWQSAQDIKDFLINQKARPIPRGGQLVGNDYVFTERIHNYDVTVKIKEISDITSNPSKAHFIHIVLKNKNGNVVGETRGYVII